MATAGKTRYGIGDTPATPPTGFVEIYPKSDKKLYQLDSDGTETDLTAGAAGGTSMQVNTGGALANADFQDSAEIAWTEAAGVVDADLVASSIAYAKIQDVSATSRFLGRITVGAGVIEELTGTQATTLLDDFVGDSGAGGTAGLVPAPGAGDAAAGKYLDSDGTWTVPPAGGTNILLDGSVHSDTVNSAALRGAIIYGTAAPAWDDLPISTADLLLRSDGTDLSWAAYTLDDAYDSGGAGAGKVITADLGPVTINGTNLEGDDLLLVDHTASGVLTQNTIGPAIFRTIRTLTSGADPADDHTNLEITRTSIITSGGTFSTQGALCFIRILDTETSGTIADTSVGMSIRVPSAGSYTGLPLKLSQNTDNEPVFNLTKAGSVQLGVGGVTAPDVTLSHGGVGILDVANVVDANTGFRVAGAATTGEYLRGNGTNFISAALLGADLDADGVTYDKIQNVVADNVFLGNNSGAGSIVDELTATEATAMLNTFTAGLKGLAPLSGGGTTNFLRADGSWAAPAGGGDVTGPGSSTDNAIVRWDGASGTAIQNSGILITDANVITRAADQTIDLTGAATRTLLVENSTGSQVTNLEVDGTVRFRNNTAFEIILSGTPTADRTMTFPDQDATIAYSGGAFHDGFSDFVGNEHIDHSSVTLTVSGDANEITVAEGAQDITASRTFNVGIADNPTIPGTYITVPVKADPDPTGANGRLFFNSTDDQLRYASSTTWRDILYSGGALGTPASGDLSNCTAYPGDSSLVTVGTITSGTWTGTDIANANIVQMAANTIKANATAGLADQADLAVGTNTVVGRVAGNIVAAQLVTAQVADSQITYAKIQDVSATDRFLGRDTVGAGVVEELTGTAATALLDNFVGDSGAGGTKGLVPAPGAGDAAAGKYLDADGTWTVPAGGGDVTGPGSSTDNAIVRWNGTSGTTIQNSGIVITDADLITNASLLGPYMQTAIILEQTTADYTLTWANPGAARAISIPDPGGTDVFVFRDDTAILTNKTIAAANNTLTLASTDLSDTAVIVLENQTNTYTAGQKQTFGHDATNAGFNLAPTAGDPSSPANGDIWYNSSTGVFRKRQGGATTDLDTSGAVSLDDAYNNGSTITVDTGTVAWNSTELGGGVLLSDFNHTATGALTAKTTGLVNYDCIRTLSAGAATVTDNFVVGSYYYRVNNDSVNDFVANGAVMLLTTEGTQDAAGAMDINAHIIKASHSNFSTSSSMFIDYRRFNDTNARFQVDRDGFLNFGPGNAAVDISLSRQTANILETANGDTFEAGGLLQFRNSTAFSINLSGTPTADRTWTFPDSDGTVIPAARTLDINGDANEIVVDLAGPLDLTANRAWSIGISDTLIIPGSLEIPNGAGGTLVNTAGEVTIDTTSRTLNFYDGTAEVVLNPLQGKAFFIEDPAAADDLPVFRFDSATTLVKVVYAISGGTNWVGQMQEATDAQGTGAADTQASDSTVTGNTTVTSFSNDTFDAGDYIRVKTTSALGSPDWLHITFYYREDA